MSLTLHVSGPGVPPVDISYDEVGGSPTEAVGENQYRAERVFIVPWSKRWTFCAGMLGWPSLEANDFSYIDNTDPGCDTSWVIRRVVPQGYAAKDLDPTGTVFLYASEIRSLVGEGRILSYDNTGVAQYNKARIVIVFSTLSYKVNAYNVQALKMEYIGIDEVVGFNNGDIVPYDQKLFNGGFFRAIFSNNVINSPTVVDESLLTRYVTIFASSQAQYTTLPFGSMRWVEPPPEERVNNTVGRVTPNREVVIIWHQVPTLPVALRSHLGTVNAFPFGAFTPISPGEGVPGGALLLTSCEVKPYRWFFNQRLYDITYRFRQLDLLEAVETSGQPLSDANNIALNGFPTPSGFTDIGHNWFLHFKGNDQPIYYNGATNDGKSSPDPASLFVAGRVGVSWPTTGWTPYQHSNFRSLFFPSAPPPVPE